MKKYLFVLLMIFGICLTNLLPIFGQTISTDNIVQPVILTNEVEEYNLAFNLEYLEDKNKTLTIDNITSNQSSSKFIPNQKYVPNLGVTNSAIWVRFTVTNNNSSRQKWQLILKDSRVGEIEVYIPQKNNQNFTIKKTGRYLPFKTREYNHRYFIFDLPLDYQEEKTVYLRLYSRSIMIFPLIITTLDNFLLGDQINLFLLGMALGIFLIVSLYTLSLSIVLKEQDYFDYTLLNFMTLMHKTCIIGFYQQYLFPNSTNEFELQIISAYLILLALIKFTNSFLELRQSNKLIYRVNSFLIIICIVCFILGFTIFNDYISIIISFLSIIVCGFVLLISLIKLKQKYLPARYFFLGMLAPLIVITLFNLSILQIYENNILALRGYPIVKIISMCLFSFALGDKIKIIKNEKQKAEQEILKNTQLYQQSIEEKNIILEQSKNQLNQILESLPVAVVVHNLDGTIKYMNQTSQKLLNKPINPNLKAQNLSYEYNVYIAGTNQIYPTSDLPSNKALKGEKIIVDNIEIHRENDLITLEVNATPIYNKKKQIQSAIAVFQDITKRKEAKQLLQEYNQKLTNEVNKRTEELAIAKEKAEIANKAKSVFLANINHELRTPLNAILGFTQIMLRSSELIEPEKEYVKIINRSGDYLLKLINNVLDLAKIEAGKTTLNNQPISLKRLLMEVKDFFALKVQEKGLEFNLELSDDIPQYIEIDGIKLRQILINLLGNAVKFTNEGKIGLKVTANQSNLESEKIILIFEVADTGFGIAEDELDIIYEPFTQATAGKYHQKSTGLGLAISRQYIQLMGGDISVTSKIDRGTTFIFNLPSKQALQSIEEEYKPSLSVKGLAESRYKYKILIVDDRLFNSQLIVSLLEPIGFELKTTENSKKALQIFSSWQPHLIFVDIRLPILEQLEIFNSQFQSSNKYHRAVIIAMTRDVLWQKQEYIFQSKCDDVLCQPITEDKIFTVIKKHLGVEYIYETVSESENVLLIKKEFPEQMLKQMPSQWLSQLYETCLILDESQFQKLVAQIPPKYQVLSQYLTELVDLIKWEEIIVLIEKYLQNN